MLDDYSLNELIKEVQRRCECCVVCAVEKDPITDEPEDGYVFAYNGDPFFCITKMLRTTTTTLSATTKEATMSKSGYGMNGAMKVAKGAGKKSSGKSMPKPPKASGKKAKGC